ncbi:MAG: EAL domain-containing protein [Crocosphaera sp.]|nr:EAL domain-containing protein [Crocosphaera sp.]
MKSNEQSKAQKIFQTAAENHEQLILENLTDMISSHTAEGTYLYISSSCQSLLGYEEKAFIGQSAEVFCHPEDCHLIKDFYQQLKQQWNPAPITYRIRHHRGHYIWLETAAKVIPDQYLGEIKRIICVSREVTQKKHKETVIKSNQQPHSFILDNLPDLVTTHSPQGVYQYVSFSSKELFGYDPNTLIGHTIESFCDHQDRHLIQQFYQELTEKKGMAAVTYRSYHKEGYKIWIETRGKPILNPKTGKIKDILCVSRDVTKRKQIEEALIHAEREYYKIFERSHQGIFKLTSEGSFLDVNPALAKIYGYESPKQLLENIDDHRNKLYVNVKEKDNIFNILKRNGEIINYQSKIYRRDREIIEVIQNIWAVSNQWGQVIYYQGTVQEVANNISEKQAFNSVLLEDSITDLPSREWFYKYLENSLSAVTAPLPDYLAILILHLDNFQLVNESLNSEKDNDLISKIIKRLRSRIRVEDTLAKLAEDEFILLVKNLSCQEITFMAQQLLNVLNYPIEVEQHQVFIRVHIGINFNEDKKYKKPEKMIRDAKLAMYQAKADQKENYAIFNPKIKADALNRIQLETELRKAIKNNQLSLYYQPIVELNTGYLSGFEALLRWEHPIKGSVSPIEFIPIAEESGLINSIGWWVLEQACYQLQTWQELSRKAAKLIINVNVSAQQLKQEQWRKKLEQLLENTNLEGRSLKLEITESCLLETVHNEVEKVQELKSLGLGLCIDDFGTGYSSLSRLHEFPIDTLKIDRSFISKLGITDKAIVPMIINLAHTLGMNVVAEGIETREQFNHLQGLNCELGQGYFFAKPMTPQEATQWVSHQVQTNV